MLAISYIIPAPTTIRIGDMPVPGHCTISATEVAPETDETSAVNNVFVDGDYVKSARTLVRLISEGGTISSQLTSDLTDDAATSNWRLNQYPWSGGLPHFAKFSEYAALLPLLDGVISITADGTLGLTYYRGMARGQWHRPRPSARTLIQPCRLSDGLRLAVVLA